MVFPVSGVEVHPLIPLLVGFVLATCTTPAGVSGAFLLLPFQMSVLGFTSPAVSATNLVYNIVAIPGGLSRYIREGRMAWPLAWVVIIATPPGVFLGAFARVFIMPDPRTFKLFVGLVLLYLGVRLLYESSGRYLKSRKQMQAVQNKFRERVKELKLSQQSRIVAGLPKDAVVKTESVSLRRVTYTFWGETFSFRPITIGILSFFVGIIGGIYGIGGGAIIAPFLVSVLGLPVYTVAAAALAGTLLTSVAGVIVYTGLAAHVGEQMAIAPDWGLGILFGVGGFLGTYAGARLQSYLPDRLIRGVLGILVTFLAIRYITQYFF
jgi:uncharacterized membrane protein YfcA